MAPRKYFTQQYYSFKVSDSITQKKLNYLAGIAETGTLSQPAFQNLIQELLSNAYRDTKSPFDI